MVTITFNNNTVLNVEQNGSTFVLEEKPNFPEDLTDVMISSENGTQHISNGLVVECYAPDSKFYFTIIEKPYQMILEERLSEQDDIICELLEML